MHFSERPHRSESAGSRAPVGHSAFKLDLCLQLEVAHEASGRVENTLFQVPGARLRAFPRLTASAEARRAEAVVAKRLARSDSLFLESIFID